MIQIQFKNMESSEMAREVVYDRIGTVVDKFPHLENGKLRVTLEMQNSPHKRGPDLFSVKLHVGRGRYRGVTVEKSEPSLYVALAEVVDHMLEKLNRFGDRGRVKRRSSARKWVEETSLEIAEKREQINVRLS